MKLTTLRDQEEDRFFFKKKRNSEITKKKNEKYKLFYLDSNQILESKHGLGYRKSTQDKYFDSMFLLFLCPIQIPEELFLIYSLIQLLRIYH